MNEPDPRKEPPVPPPFELRQPPEPTPPAQAPPQPTAIDILTRRLSSLEHDLATERERARLAESALRQQEALKTEVESQLKSLSERIRREKSERESEEEKARGRGRVDALEKRLDEMHQSWASLIKETIGSSLAQNIGQSPAAAHQEFSVLSTALAGITEKLSSFQKRQELEDERIKERFESLSRERAAIQRMFEEQNHETREKFIKERTAREREVLDRIEEVEKKITDAAAVQERQTKQSRGVEEGLSRVYDALNTPAKTKNEQISALEFEKNELARTLSERGQDMAKLSSERREIERSMGESIVSLDRELSEEKRKNIAFSARLTDFELKIQNLKDQLETQKRLAQDKDEKCARLMQERDELAKALMAEAGRVKASINDRSNSDENWTQRILALQQKLSEQGEALAKESVAANELRAQLSTLTEHLTRTLQDKDATLSRSALQDSERQTLEAKLREKEEMISMLNSAFQQMIKKPD
jgi:DNA repair exonuclease SbcCD ATPase subunit